MTENQVIGFVVVGGIGVWLLRLALVGAWRGN